jgi:hypothetical protein
MNKKNKIIMEKEDFPGVQGIQSQITATNDPQDMVSYPASLFTGSTHTLIISYKSSYSPG